MTLSTFLRRGAPAPGEPSQPRAKHVEIWGDLLAQNRFLRRMAGGAIALAFLGLAAGSYGVLVGLYRPVAFHVDADGRATYVGRLREQSAPSDPEVRFVAKEFLKRYLAFNSLTVETDLADAWNLMTEELRGEQDRVLADYKATHDGQEFVAFIEAQGIQTVLEFDAKKTEITDHNGKTFTVRLRGTMRTWPLNRAGESAAFAEKAFETFVTLVRCPRTEQTPNGLLVAKVSTRTFVDEERTQPRMTAADTSSDRGRGAASEPRGDRDLSEDQARRAPSEARGELDLSEAKTDSNAGTPEGEAP